MNLREMLNFDKLWLKWEKILWLYNDMLLWALTLKGWVTFDNLKKLEIEKNRLYYIFDKIKSTVKLEDRKNLYDEYFWLYFKHRREIIVDHWDYDPGSDWPLSIIVKYSNVVDIIFTSWNISKTSFSSSNQIVDLLETISIFDERYDGLDIKTKSDFIKSLISSTPNMDELVKKVRKWIVS